MKLGGDNCHAWKQAGRGRLSQAGVAGKSKGRIRLFGRVARYLKYAVETGGGFNWVWGYDEITWFAHQTREYRAHWLQYAWDWVRKTDTNGFLEMPGGRTARSPDTQWYFANNPSPAVPTGMGDEDAIRAVWTNDNQSEPKN